MRFETYRTYVRDHPQFRRVYVNVSRQPSWVLKLALAMAALVIVVPIVLLTLAAVVMAGVVFLAASGIAAVMSLFNPRRPGGPPTPRDDGRRNVRVVERPQ